MSSNQTSQSPEEKRLKSDTGSMAGGESNYLSDIGLAKQSEAPPTAANDDSLGLTGFGTARLKGDSGDCLSDIGLANETPKPRRANLGIAEFLSRGQAKNPKRRKHWGWITAELLFIYVLISPLVIMPFCSNMLFFPDKNLPDAPEIIDKITKHFNAEFRQISITTPTGPVLHGWYFKLPGAKRTFLINHGNAGNIYYRIPHVNVILQSGCSVLLWDYEGYGKSEGEPNMTNVCQDALVAYDYVNKTLGIAEQNIVLYGESIGCAVTCYAARQRHPGAIVLQSPFASLKEAAADKLPWFRLYPPFIWYGPLLDNAAAMADPHPPLLIIHGAKDTILPCRYSEEIMARASEPKSFIKLPGAGHNDVTMVDLEVLMPGVIKFVSNLPN